MRNVLRLTRKATLTSAATGWKAVRIIHLSRDGDSATCELCGTRFWRGALMTHPARRAKVAIGGTCLKVIRMAAFGPARTVKQRRTATWRLFDEHYSDLVGRGSWLKWMITNAPPRLSEAVLDLDLIGTTKSEAEMRSLIRFHDAHRRYPASAVLEAHVFRLAGIPVPEHLTLLEAKRFDRLARKKFASKVASAQSKVLVASTQRLIRGDHDMAAFWKSLSAIEKRVAAALAHLSERGVSDIAEPLAARFEVADPASRNAQFVWNPRIGLGYVGAADHYGTTAYVRFWENKRRSHTRYDLRSFRTLSPLDLRAVDRLEHLAREGKRGHHD